MTEESTILFKSKSFVLGYCACNCGTEIPIRAKNNYIQRYFANHRNLGVHPPNYKGGRKKTRFGYIHILKPEHPSADSNGYTQEHRVVWEEHNKASLLPWIDIHHINHIRDDNRIENLQPITKREHKSMHSLKDKSNRYCYICGNKETLTRLIRNTGLLHYYWYKDFDSPDKWNCNKCHYRELKRWRLKKGEKRG